MATDKRVVVSGESVKFIGNETEAKDGTKVPLTLTFDFAGVNKVQLLKWAAANRLIAWRTKGAKNLTASELKALDNSVVVCKNQMEHIESETEKRARKLLEIAEEHKLPVDAIEKLAMEYIAKLEEHKAAEAALQAELEKGESAEKVEVK